MNIHPNKVLTKLDFPTFCLPIIETIIGFLIWIFSFETPCFSYIADFVYNGLAILSSSKSLLLAGSGFAISNSFSYNRFFYCTQIFISKLISCYLIKSSISFLHFSLISLYFCFLSTFLFSCSS